MGEGGGRAHRGRRAAGAGAILWGPPRADGTRKVRAKAVVALPNVPHAQVAEAWGGSAAVTLLTAIPAEVRLAKVIGDNLGVVRYGAETGALRNPAMHQPLAEALATAAEKGWSLRWRAVRRRLNKAADEVATEGVWWAQRLAAQGVTAPQTRVMWFDT